VAPPHPLFTKGVLLMKKEVDWLSQFFSMDVVEGVSFVWSQWRIKKLPLVIFVALCLNLLIAPLVYAAADGTLERHSAWAIGILGLVTLSVVVYLFIVVLQPEKF
jgi:F subunit of K+-transporting ATPase (Potass_KdpF)